MNPRLKMSHEGAARVWHFQPRVVIFPCLTNDCVSYVLSYGQLQESWIISGLQWRSVNEYRLPSKNTHSPNYCSWLAVCVNYSANFYCKIALIYRFKLYLIKTYSKTPKNKNKTKRKQKQRRMYSILRLHLVNVTRDSIKLRPIMSPGVADWSKRRHVTLSIIICSPLHGHPWWHYNVTPGDIIMSPGWHYIRQFTFKQQSNMNVKQDMLDSNAQ